VLVVKHLPDVLQGVLMVAFGSLVIGGIPYLAFLSFFLAWMGDKPEERVRRAVRLAPLRYTSLLTTFALLLSFVADGSVSRDDLFMLWLLAGAALGVGYVYVALMELGVWWLRRRGVTVDA
jgi:hypothetical protein